MATYPSSSTHAPARRYLPTPSSVPGGMPRLLTLIASFSNPTQGDGDKPHAVFWQAESFFQIGQFDRAEQAYRALQAYPRHARQEEALRFGLGAAECRKVSLGP